MKWKEMSAFIRVFYVLMLVSALAAVIPAIFVLIDYQAKVFINISRALVTVALVCQGIINWQEHRKVAIVHFVCAALCLAATILGIFSK